MPDNKQLREELDWVTDKPQLEDLDTEPRRARYDVDAAHVGQWSGPPHLRRRPSDPRGVHHRAVVRPASVSLGILADLADSQGA